MMASLACKVKSSDGLPQEVCLLCRDQLDLSITFQRQVLKADCLLREHLTFQAAPTLTGDPLSEPVSSCSLEQDRLITEEKKEEKSQIKNDDTIPLPANWDEVVFKGEEDSFAVAEPWPESLGGRSTKEDNNVEDMKGTEDKRNLIKEEADGNASEKRVNQIKLKNGKKVSSKEENEEDNNEYEMSETKLDQAFINCIKCSCQFCQENNGDVESNDSSEELKCDFCQEKFETVDFLKTHQAQHGKDEWFKCKHCVRSFRALKGLHAHQREHTKLRRDNQRQSNRQQNLGEPEQVQLKGTTQQQQAQQTDKPESQSMQEGPKTEDVKEKEESVSKERKLQEQQQGVRRSSRSSKAPERHVVPHYSCSKCERMYSDQVTLKNHEKSHLAIRYKCNHCGKKFSDKELLARHIQSSHIAKQLRRLHLQKSVQKQEQHPPVAKPVSSNQSSRNRNRRQQGHRCEICGKSYEIRSHLFSHMKSHKSPVQLCEVCGKTVSFSAYPQHKRSHLSALSHEIFQCNQCEKKFNNKVSLRSHKNSYHGTLKYTCEVCGKQFTTMALMRHHQNVHSGKRDHACQVCGRAFTLKVTLKAHMRIHTGEMPYGCDNCGRHFTWKTTYRNHVASCKNLNTSVNPTPNSVSVKSRSVDVKPKEDVPILSYVNSQLMSQSLPQELRIDYSEDTKYEVPIDYSDEARYRHFPLIEAKYFPTALNLSEDIKCVSQLVSYPEEANHYNRDLKSPM